MNEKLEEQKPSMDTLAGVPQPPKVPADQEEERGVQLSLVGQFPEVEQALVLVARHKRLRCGVLKTHSEAIQVNQIQAQHMNNASLGDRRPALRACIDRNILLMLYAPVSGILPGNAAKWFEYVKYSSSSHMH